MSTRSRPAESTSSRKRKSSYSPTYELPALHARSAAQAAADLPDDPDFLALSKKQRRAVDDAFKEGLRGAWGGDEDADVEGRAEEGRKRRKVDEGAGGGFDVGSAEVGGFEVPDGGSASGGFLPDDVDMDTAGGSGGGFFDEDSTDNPHTSPAHPTPIPSTSSRSRQTRLLPLSSLPRVMSLLDLSVDDDVLAVFESSGFQTLDSEMVGVDRVRGGPEGDEGWDGMGGIVGYTTLRDFRAVCAAMLEPELESEMEDGPGTGMEVDVPVDRDGDEEDSQDVDRYEEEGDDSPLSDLDSDDDGEDAYAPASSIGKKRKGNAKSNPTRTKPNRKRPHDPSTTADLLLPSTSTPKPRLDPDQRATVTRLWELMFSSTPSSLLVGQTKFGGGGKGERFLGREQVRRWAEVMGETWNDQEITDMIELFSTQPGKRGLSYDDFSTVLVRGGLL